MYSIKELCKMGINLSKNSKNINISKKVSIYNPTNIFLKNNIRIDDYCIISANGKIIINNYIHIGCFSYITSALNKTILIDDYAGLSSHCRLYGSTDCYTGYYMTNPTVPKEYTNVSSGNIIIKKHSILGTGSVVLPSCILETGTATGANSIIKKNTEPWSIYGGSPTTKINERKEIPFCL
jgi:acetyltransferase-like isoleucine patch superfamily enzyme